MNVCEKKEEKEKEKRDEINDFCLNKKIKKPCTNHLYSTCFTYNILLCITSMEWKPCEVSSQDL